MAAPLLQAWVQDAPGILATATAVTVMVAGAERLRALGVRPAYTRKGVHIVGGFWCLALPWLFTHLASVAIAAAGIAAVFEGGRRTGRLGGLHATDPRSAGPALFPLGVTAAGAVVWGDVPSFVASVATLTVGDAAAALVGERFGARRYQVGDHHRSLEGSTALFVTAAALSAAALSSSLTWPEALAGGLLVAGVVAALEAISPVGLDNVTIPVGAALGLAALRDGVVDVAGLAGAAVAAGAIVAVSLRRGHLTGSGGFATWLLGVALGACGGVGWFLAAAFVFAGVNVASKAGRAKKRFEAKGATRDHLQVLANAGLAIPAAIAYAATGDPLAVGAFVGVLGFAGADTLASEIGALAGRPPVSITTWKPVAPGASGGVSTLGYGAAALGGVLPGVGLFAGGQGAVDWVGIGLVAGLVGCTVDSVLGAVAQARYRCSACGATTEHEAHCGAPGALASGVAWMDNDAVNLLGSASAAAVGLALAAALAGAS